MKRIFISAILISSIASIFAADITPVPPQKENAALPDHKDRASYAIGLNIGKSFKQSDLDLNLDRVVQGIKDSLSGTNTLLTEAEAQQTIQGLQVEMRQKQEAKRKTEGEKNKQQGQAYLEANKTKEGVKTTASGLQYKVIKEGTGPMPKASDQVKCHYRGTLIDGTEFDSSYKRGEPAIFKVTGVIKGWTEALQMMKVGSKWDLTIPSELAYGERGQGVKISPNAVLNFEVELIEIIPGAEPAPVTSDIIKVPSAEEMKKGAQIEVIKPGSTNGTPFKNSSTLATPPKLPPAPANTNKPATTK